MHGLHNPNKFRPDFVIRGVKLEFQLDFENVKRGEEKFSSQITQVSYSI